MGFIEDMLITKKEVWQDIADGWDGMFVAGGMFGTDRLHIFLDPYEIVLDGFSDGNGYAYSRFRSPFKNSRELYFKLIHENFIHRMGKYFGMEDINIGSEAFDRHFLVKGNRPKDIQAIFIDRDIHDTMISLKSVHLEIRSDEGMFKNTDYRAGIDELYFRVGGLIRDKKEIQRIFKLFVLLLNKINTLELAS